MKKLQYLSNLCLALYFMNKNSSLPLDSFLCFMLGKPHSFKCFEGQVASSSYVLRTWCQKSPPTYTRYVLWPEHVLPPFTFVLCSLTWKMLQVQNIPVESGCCQNWEWEWHWYLYKYTALPPTPSLQPCFSPYPSPKSNLVWADSMAIFGFQSKKPGNWFWSHSRSKIIML